MATDNDPVELIFDPQGVIERASIPACDASFCSGPAVQQQVFQACASDITIRKVVIFNPHTQSPCFCTCGGSSAAPASEGRKAASRESDETNTSIVIIPKLYLARENFLFTIATRPADNGIPTVEVAPANGKLACGLLTADLYHIGMQNALPRDARIAASLVTGGAVTVASFGRITKGDTVRFRQSSPAVVEAGTPEPSCAFGTATETASTEGAPIKIELQGTVLVSGS